MLLLFPLLFAALGYCGYQLYGRMFPEPAEPAVEQAALLAKPATGLAGMASTALLGGSSGSSERKPLSKADYLAAHEPRIPDLPSSAPIYDQLTKPVSYPKTFCVATMDEALLERVGSKMTLGGGRLHGCRCNTQQGSKVDISFDACMAHVDTERLIRPSPIRYRLNSKRRDRSGRARDEPVRRSARRSMIAWPLWLILSTRRGRGTELQSVTFDLRALWFNSRLRIISLTLW